MNQNETRTLWISIGIAVAAMFLIYSHLQEKRAEYDLQFGARKSVVVAKKDINEMQTIDISMLTVVDRPAGYIEPMALTDPEDAVGQVAASPIKEGEQILQTKIIKPGPATGISHQVTPKKRAITIPIDETRGVAKLLKPGDRIDLIAALDFGNGPNQKREVKTILQDIPILATGIRVVNNVPRTFELDSTQKNLNIVNLNESNFTTITVEVNPQEAQTLIYILSTSPGSLFVSLRNPSDRVQESTRITNIENVLNKPSQDLLSGNLRQPSSFVPAPQIPVRPAPVNTSPAKRPKSGPYEDL